MSIISLSAMSLWPHMDALAGEQMDVRSQTLLCTTSAWNSVPYDSYPKGTPELSVLRMTIAPCSQLQWHTHPMPVAAYILSGEITIEEPNGNRRLFVAGQALSEIVNTIHRGVAGDQPVALIVFYAGVKGMPLLEQAP